MGKAKRPLFAGRTYINVRIPSVGEDVYVLHSRRRTGTAPSDKGRAHGQRRSPPSPRPEPDNGGEAIDPWDDISTFAIHLNAAETKLPHHAISKIRRHLSNAQEPSTRIVVTSPEPLDLSFVEDVSRTVLKDAPNLSLGFAFDLDLEGD
jgi:hypothetical protein